MAFSSYFEATPPKRRDSLEDEIPVLIFRPFGNVPKLFFKNVLVGEKVSKQLLLRNPQSETLDVELIKLPPLDAGFKFSSKKFQISSLQEVRLTVEWQPAKEGKFIYSIPLKTNTNGRFNFSVVCASIQKKPLKKNSKMTGKRTITNHRIVLKSYSSPNSFKKGSNKTLRPSAMCGESSLKSKLPSKENCATPAKSYKNRLTEEKLVSSVVLNFESVKTEEEEEVVETAVKEEDLKNCSSETYVMSPGSTNLALEIKEATVNSQCSFISTKTHYTTKEVNLFSDVTFSPISSALPQQPRQATCRETFALSTPFKPILEAPEISSVKDDIVSPLSTEMENEGIRFTPSEKIESCFAHDIHSKFLDINISPVKEVQMDISGISELDLTKEVNSNRNTFEISLPSFTPLQISKQSCFLSSFDYSLRDIRNTGNEESCVGRSNFSEFRSPQSIVQATQVSSPKGKRRLENETTFPESSRILEEVKGFKSLINKLGNEEDMLPHQTVKSVIKRSINSEEWGKNIDKNIETSFQVQSVKREIEGTSGIVSSCQIYKGQEIVSEHSLKCSEQNEALTNYTVFTPSKKILKLTKENISPEISSDVLSTKEKKMAFNGNVTSIRNRNTLKPLTNQTKVKRVQLAPPKLVLASGKKKLKEKTLMNTDKILAEYANPSYCITATTINPFINSSVFYDLQWFDDREREFVRWLNVLLTPPAQLSSSDEIPKVDVADLWTRCCKSEVAPAPSRETVSSLYLVNHRLDSLRRKACTMLCLPGVAQVLSKVTVQIEKGILSFRNDRSIVRDIVLKTTIIELLLCYNPLWLRIGLETVMGKTIPIESNSDRVGIVGFIARNFLSDPYLVERYAYVGVTNMFKPGFEEAIKKHILKKFFLLVFFLDYAKENKLIIHNPCLFCKNAKYKESRSLLLAFARDFLSGVGDITKHLRNLGYVVKHQQTYLDEYSYAVKHLGSDLRDGVRLAKVTEIILQQTTLTPCLRAPAISKLQKIHNVKVALTALIKGGHVIEGDITAKDIVEGHREKTMSLLWQIIYKFQITWFSNAACKIQSWYRSLYIIISRRIWLKKEMLNKRVIEDTASKVIQKHWRRYLAQQQYKRLISATFKIQKWYKSIQLTKQQQSQYLEKRKAILTIQRFFRRELDLRRGAILEEQKKAVSKISNWYYNIKLTRYYEERYQKMKYSAIFIQRWYRASCIAKSLRLHFVLERQSAMCIQKWYRYLKLSRAQRHHYLQQKNAALVIQKWYRLSLLTRKMRNLYLQKKKAVVTIQRWYQACLAMKLKRKEYLKLRFVACKIQTYFRAKKQLRYDMESFIKIRNAIAKIQLWFRSVQLMRIHRASYLETLSSIVKIQIWYRATNLMKQQRKLFLNQRRAAIVIQQKFRAVKFGRQFKHLYEQQRKAAVLIQLWYRSCVITRNQKQQYLKQKSAALKIQRFFKSTMITRKQRKIYERQISAVLKIQKWYRACIAMRNQRMLYIKQQSIVRQIQRHFRSKKLMQLERSAFTQKRIAVKKIQIWLRSSILMKQDRKYYLQIRKSTIKIQIWFRATSCMRSQRNLYLKQRNAAIVIQQNFRAIHLSRIQKSLYCVQRLSAIKIQKWFRNICVTKLQRQQFLKIKSEFQDRDTARQSSAAIKIQKWYRLKVALIKQKTEYERQNLMHEKEKEAVRIIEFWYLSVLRRRNKATLQIKPQNNQEAAMRACATKIQAYWRGYHTRKIMKISHCVVDIQPPRKRVLNEKVCLKTKYLQAIRTYVSHTRHSYAVIISASSLIESCVRLSREICEEFLLSSHLNTLIDLIETLNRSVPAENVLEVLLKILMHVLRHPLGVHRVIEIDNAIPVLAETTYKWCTKRTEELFCHLCTVWWLLGQNNDIAETLKNTRCVNVSLKKCYSSVISWNTSLKHPATPIRSRLPDPTPNWCIRRTNRPRIFENGRFAINEVLKKFNIMTS